MAFADPYIPGAGVDAQQHVWKNFGFLKVQVIAAGNHRDGDVEFAGNFPEAVTVFDNVIFFFRARCTGEQKVCVDLAEQHRTFDPWG